MARRVVSRGVDPGYLTTLGIPPWDTARGGDGEYVGGPYCDDGPLRALLWTDLRAAYRCQRIPHQHATIFEMHLAGVSLRRIAEQFKLSHTTIASVVDRVESMVRAYPHLGLITVIYEELGGWHAVAEYLFGN